MTTVCLVGSTGLVGSYILQGLLSHPAIKTVHAFSRSPLPTDAKLHHITTSNPDTWPSEYPSDCFLFLSALGTTTRQAGGFEKQREIDFDLNLSLAKAAKQNGTKVYILVSTASASPTSRFPYPRVRGELDEEVKAIGFEKTIILKPGLLIGHRKDSRPGEFVARKLASLLGFVSGGRLKDSWAQDADVVARAAINAGLDAILERNTEKVKILSQSDIVRLGRAMA